MFTIGGSKGLAGIWGSKRIEHKCQRKLFQKNSQKHQPQHLGELHQVFHMYGLFSILASALATASWLFWKSDLTIQPQG